MANIGRKETAAMETWNVIPIVILISIAGNNYLCVGDGDSRGLYLHFEFASHNVEQSFPLLGIWAWSIGRLYPYCEFGEFGIWNLGTCKNENQPVQNDMILFNVCIMEKVSSCVCSKL